MLTYYLITLALTFALTVIILKKLIPYLKSKKMGQKILDIGPRWHKSKEGTPTMGGISFIVASVAVTAAMFIFGAVKGDLDSLTFAIISLVFALLNGAIGIIDDKTKFAKGKNEGLLSWQKYLLQLILAAVYLIVLSELELISTELYIPFVKQSINLGFFYYPLMLLLITGTVNSVNLTDGIDGLAASETAIVAAFFSAVGFFLGSSQISVLSAALLGGVLGFLVYNFHPARVFMGDTGSLFLGGFVTALSFMSGNPLIIIIVGFMYILESISDIIQVGYFKLTHGKRIFKMAPIHHHFEKCGWSEIKIVAVFSALTLVLSAISFIFDIL